MIFKKTTLFHLFVFISFAAGTEILLHGQDAGHEPGAADGSYHFVILPDTQYYYGDQGPGNFGKWLAQMNWIRDHAESHNIKYVLHLGDITDQADHSSTHLTQWGRATSAANGIMDKVPMSLVTGNHDGLENSRNSLFSNPEYFGPGSVYANQPTLIETMDPGKWENSVHRIEIEGRSWLIICLEWGPRDEVIAWADDVLDRFPDDYAILTMHAYLFRDSSRFDWELLGSQNRDDRQSGNPIGYEALTGDPEGANDGQLIWNKLIRDHSNVKLVLNGHVSRSGHGRRVSINDDRHFVQQHLVNFQHWTGDGNARMRLMEFNPVDDSVKVKSFSPLSGEILKGPDLEFAFTFSLSTRPLKTHYREALQELDPVAAFRLQGEDARRPLLSQFPMGERAQAEGFADTDGDAWRFRSGRRIHYESSQTTTDAWTALLWFRSNAAQETLPILRIEGESGEVLSVFADTSPIMLLPLDDSHSQSVFEESINQLTVMMEPSQWHHFALKYEGGQLMPILDGEVLSTIDFPVAEVSSLTLGDFADDSVATDADAEWNMVDFSYHGRALSIPDIEWLWRSAFCQTISGEVIVNEGLDAIPAFEVQQDSYPGFALRPENGGEALLFGTSETSIYRIQDRAGARRDPHSRYLRMPRTLEYSDGILLTTPQVSDSSNPAVAPPPVRWKLSNRIEGLYFGSSYTLTRMSVLNTPLSLPNDGSFAKLNSTFFPFANDWKGGYINQSGQYLYGQEDVLEEVAVSKLGGGRYRLTPPEVWNPLTLLGQTSEQNTRMTVQPVENGWEVTIHEGGQPSSGRVPFAFVFIPEDASEVRSGWVDPADSASEGSPWEKTGTGSYRFTAPLESGPVGVLQITPGAAAGGEAPLFKLYSSDEGVWELKFEVNGEMVDVPFAWAWISLEAGYPAKATPEDARVLEALEDAAYGDLGWYFSERLSWIFVDSESWPWVWSPGSGWLFLFLETAPADDFWFFEWASGAFLYVDRAVPSWVWSTKDGWIPWPLESLN